MGDFPQRGAFRAVWTFKGTWQWVALFSVLSPLFVWPHVCQLEVLCLFRH